MLGGQQDSAAHFLSMGGTGTFFGTAFTESDWGVFIQQYADWYQPQTFTSGVWTHVFVVRDVANDPDLSPVSFYVDGVKLTRGGGNYNPGVNNLVLTTTLSDLYVGQRSTLDSWTELKVCDVRFYSRALTAAEVLEIYNGGGISGPTCEDGQANGEERGRVRERGSERGRERVK